MIKAIIFDCFGVLTTDKWKEFMGTLPEEQRLPALDINHAYDTGFITEAEFTTKIKELTGRDPGEVEALPISEIGKNTELLTYIKSLKPQYKIGLLSNIATNWIRDYFLTPEEQALFDQMVLSFEVHMTKPEPRIFQIVYERLGVEPQEVVLVDDNVHYTDAARDLGMQVVTYGNFAQMKQELEGLLANSKN